MRKRIVLLLLCIVTAFVFLCPAMADGSVDDKRVFDEDDILDSSEEDKLQDRIEEIQKTYNFDVVILIVNKENLPYDSLMAVTDDYYNNGITSKYAFKNDGLLIFLNMCNDEDGRDYWFNGCDRGAEIFDNYFFNYMRDNTGFLNKLKNANYYGAFDETLDYVEIFLKQAETGKPYSDSNPYKKPKEPMSGTKFTVLALIETGIAFLFGKGYANKLRASMNTAIKRTEATEYINQSSFNVSRAQDIFMYSNVTRTPIPTETRSGGGSGSSIHSSGGHSHSGGGGHF